MSIDGECDFSRISRYRYERARNGKAGKQGSTWQHLKCFRISRPTLHSQTCLIDNYVDPARQKVATKMLMI